jgi:hypothetical protein
MKLPLCAGSGEGSDHLGSLDEKSVFDYIMETTYELMSEDYYLNFPKKAIHSNLV